MPEGPECRYIANSLHQYLKNKTMRNIIIHSGRYQRHGPPIGFTECEFQGTTIQNIQVHGKLIYWKFSNDWYLLNTLGMSGQWLIKDTGEKHDHIEIMCDDNTRVWYRDVRNFGTLRFVRQPTLDKALCGLGHDILSDTEISREEWKVLVGKNMKKNICVFLMNQKNLAGVGNYLKSESLYQANIDPRQTLEDIDEEILWHLYSIIRSISKESFESHGASFHSYQGPKGEKGAHGFTFKVYGQKKDPNGHNVERLNTPDKRSTYWVPIVQQ